MSISQKPHFYKVVKYLYQINLKKESNTCLWSKFPLACCCLHSNKVYVILKNHHANRLLSTHRKPLSAIPHHTPNSQQTTNYSLLQRFVSMPCIPAIHYNFYYARSCGFLGIISSASRFLLRCTQKPHFLITQRGYLSENKAFLIFKNDAWVLFQLSCGWDVSRPSFEFKSLSILLWKLVF